VSGKKKATKLADCGRELGAVLDRIDREHQALVELVKERKGRIAALEKRAHHLRDLLAGRDFEQEEIPGTEASVTGEVCGNCGNPADAPSPACKDECDHGRSTGAACRDCGEAAKRAGGALTTDGYCWDCEVKRHPERAEPAKPRKKKQKGVGKCAGCGDPAERWCLGEKRCGECAKTAEIAWRYAHPGLALPAGDVLP
jgi:hypothetical protein